MARPQKKGNFKELLGKR